MVEKVASFTDLSTINAAAAQFLLDHNNPPQLEAEAALEQLTEAIKAKFKAIRLHPIGTGYYPSG